MIIVSAEQFHQFDTAMLGLLLGAVVVAGVVGLAAWLDRRR